MSFLVRLSALLLAAALAAPTPASANPDPRGGGVRVGGGGGGFARGGGFSGGGSSGGRGFSGGFSRGSSGGSFVRSGGSSFRNGPTVRSSPSRSFSPPSTGFRRTGPTVSAPRTTGPVTGYTRSGPTTGYTRSGPTTGFRRNGPTTGTTRTGPTPTTTGFPRNAPTVYDTGARVRNEAALGRLRTWGQTRTPTTGTTATPRTTGTTVPFGGTTRTRTSPSGDTTPLANRFAGVRSGATGRGAATTTTRGTMIERNLGGGVFGAGRTRTTGDGATTPSPQIGGGVARGGSVRTGGVRTGGVTGGSGDARLAGTRTGGVRVGGVRTGAFGAATRTGGVSYSSGYVPQGGVRYSHNHGGHHDGWYGGAWWGGWYGGWGAGWGFGYYPYYQHYWHRGCWGFYWDPWYYNTYSSFWIGGVPAFGYGCVYYTDPVYVVSQPYYVPFVVEETPPGYIVEQPPVVQPEAPGAAPEAAPAEAPPAPQAEPQHEGPPPGAEEFGKGVEAFLAGNYEMALARFLQVVSLDEKNGEAWLAVTQSGFALGRYDEAAEGVRRAATLGAFPRGYRFDPRGLYPQEGRFDALMAALAKHREEKPDDPNGHLVAAYLYVALGERAKANEALMHVLELTPDEEAAEVLTVAQLPPLPPPPAPDAATPPAAQGN